MATGPALPPGDDGERSSLRWPALAGAAVALGLAGFAWWRRRRQPRPIDQTAPTEPAATPPPAVPPSISPVAASSVPTTPARVPGGLVTAALKPVVGFDLRARRAGVDTLRAILQFELVVGNTGRAAGQAVLIETWLLSASRDQDAVLAGLFAKPAGEAMLAPFDLPAAATVELAGETIAPREALAVMTSGERKLFIPMLAVRASYRDTRGTPQVATAAFMIGQERDGQDRLVPLPLDRGSRLHDRLGVRPYQVPAG